MIPAPAFAAASAAFEPEWPPPGAAAGAALPAPAAAESVRGGAPPAPARHRGIHKIFLGFAPGVGKTYNMLAEAIRRRQRGEDVAVAFVETHGRKGVLELVPELEVIPRQIVAYHGLRLEELDLDAVLARHPQVALVDELAHTNPPGLKHAKRFEDVEVILSAGIDVVSTMNIQHIESLNPVIFRLTGVQVRETVPDWVVEKADEKVLVDVTPEALIHRMERGDIYAPGKVPQALAHFFQPRNLLALRELALRQTAEEADLAFAHLPGEPAPAAMYERIAVCVGGNETGQELISRGWRIARRLRCPIYILNVRTLSADDEPERLAANLQFARDLGADVVTREAHDLAGGIVAFAREQRITQLLLGLPRHRGWREFLPSSLLPRLFRELPGVDFHLVALRDEANHES